MYQMWGTRNHGASVAANNADMVFACCTSTYQPMTLCAWGFHKSPCLLLFGVAWPARQDSLFPTVAYHGGEIDVRSANLLNTSRGRAYCSNMFKGIVGGCNQKLGWVSVSPISPNA